MCDGGVCLSALVRRPESVGLGFGQCDFAAPTTVPIGRVPFLPDRVIVPGYKSIHRRVGGTGAAVVHRVVQELGVAIQVFLMLLAAAPRIVSLDIGPEDVIQPMGWEGQGNLAGFDPLALAGPATKQTQLHENATPEASPKHGIANPDPLPALARYGVTEK